MKFFRYLFIGIIFGITLTKAEIISWYRIYEMFRFQSFHMYGVIGSAVILGVLIIQVIKKTKMKGLDGQPIVIEPKEMGFARYIIGGTIFGAGWALTGACPGPLFILLGNGVGVIAVTILAAVAGTYTYGLLKDKLPH
ncbi:YeeE/YedE family protein [Marinoscillum sp. MHG1-6]|uniref:YeeE/YedE family protein n=1 Tax=Marinoscillum sp. MHG1-6 TaxID=2959627 RepID=UPI002157941F|nr:DUF6691 family protein [Marinoscillum sp. MHG1-6]